MLSIYTWGKKTFRSKFFMGVFDDRKARGCGPWLCFVSVCWHWLSLGKQLWEISLMSSLGLEEGEACLGHVFWISLGSRRNEKDLWQQSTRALVGQFRSVRERVCGSCLFLLPVPLVPKINVANSCSWCPRSYVSCSGSSFHITTSFPCMNSVLQRLLFSLSSYHAWRLPVWLFFVGL